MNRQETVTDAYGTVIRKNVNNANGNITKTIDARGYLMAIWQFTFLVIPERVILKKNDNIRYDLKSNGFDDLVSWDGYCLSESSIEKLAKTLIQKNTWSDCITQFGCLDETCIELFYEKNTLLEVSVRLDLRSLTLNVLDTVIEFIKDNKALILTSKGIVLRPVLDDIITEIKKSHAYAFVKNPQEFLSSLIDRQS